MVNPGVVMGGLVVLGAVAPAHAEPRVDVGIVVGGHLTNDDNELGIDEGETAQAQKSAPLAGVRLGLRFTRWLGIEGEAVFLPTSARDGSADVVDLAYRGHLIGYLPRSAGAKLHPFAVAGGGATSVIYTDNWDSQFRDTDLSWHFGAGVRYDLSPRWALRGDLRVIIPPSASATGVTGSTLDGELLLSLSRCLTGCDAPAAAPAPIGDTDGDGLRDDVDTCPTEPEDLDGNADTDGCPETEPVADADADGIPDGDDKCPLEPEDQNGFEDANGCPDADADDDGDGVPNATDACRTEPEDRDAFEDANGCPDPDNDGDGVLDAADQCMAEGDPNRLENVNAYKDDDGCADTVPAAVLQALKGVQFASAKAKVAKTSYAILDEAVAYLKAHPNMRIAIKGHTDDQPPAKGSGFADNVELSTARAEAVKAYLVRKGIAADRLEASGLGDSQPVIQGTSEEARAANRRVEIVVLGGGSATP